MKKITIILSAILIVVLSSCGGSTANEAAKSKDESKETTVAKEEAPVEEKAAEDVKPSERVDLSTKGVGPIKDLGELPPIDEKMVKEGLELFQAKCTACHKAKSKFIGPALKGVTEMRTPEWIMNMILNPTEMVEKDPLAKELLVEFNGSPMANQNLTEDEARKILEFFRTLN
ncbi:MAG: cytochrome c [Flavobacteriales bacterium]|nr:cytochrome c [Flavobacteriales bacterium]